MSFTNPEFHWTQEHLTWHSTGLEITGSTKPEFHQTPELQNMAFHQILGSTSPQQDYGFY